MNETKSSPFFSEQAKTAPYAGKKFHTILQKLKKIQLKTQNSNNIEMPADASFSLQRLKKIRLEKEQQLLSPQEVFKCDNGLALRALETDEGVRGMEILFKQDQQNEASPELREVRSNIVRALLQYAESMGARLADDLPPGFAKEFPRLQHAPNLLERLCNEASNNKQYITLIEALSGLESKNDPHAASTSSEITLEDRLAKFSEAHTLHMSLPDSSINLTLNDQQKKAFKLGLELSNLTFQEKECFLRRFDFKPLCDARKEASFPFSDGSIHTAYPARHSAAQDIPETSELLEKSNPLGKTGPSKGLAEKVSLGHEFSNILSDPNLNKETCLSLVKNHQASSSVAEEACKRFLLLPKYEGCPSTEELSQAVKNNPYIDPIQRKKLLKSMKTGKKFRTLSSCFSKSERKAVHSPPSSASSKDLLEENTKLRTDAQDMCSDRVNSWFDKTLTAPPTHFDETTEIPDLLQTMRLLQEQEIQPVSNFNAFNAGLQLENTSSFSFPALSPTPSTSHSTAGFEKWRTKAPAKSNAHDVSIGVREDLAGKQRTSAPRHGWQSQAFRHCLDAMTKAFSCLVSNVSSSDASPDYTLVCGSWMKYKRPQGKSQKMSSSDESKDNSKVKAIPHNEKEKAPASRLHAFSPDASALQITPPSSSEWRSRSQQIKKNPLAHTPKTVWHSPSR